MRPALPQDAPALAALHALGFSARGERSWSAEEFAALLAAPACCALLAPAEGFILARTLGEEAEILTLSVAPARQAQGLGARLLDALLASLAAQGVRRVHLEVAADNAAALALYRKRGFAQAGRRPAYYARAGAPAADALLLALTYSGGEGGR